MLIRKKFILYATLLFLLARPGIVDSSSSVTNIFHKGYDAKYESLLNYLETVGYSKEITQFLFNDSRIQYYPNLILTKIPENNVDADEIELEVTKHKTEDFIQEYYSDLVDAEIRYGVEKEAIAAIIYVETKFGHFTGDYRIFNILSSLALSDQEFAIREMRLEIKKQYASSSTMQLKNILSYYENYAQKKAQMARYELANLIEMYINENYNIMELRGSFAGAFGYCQFMPSSFNQYAVDGDGDNKIDLFNYRDAIHSTANYLKEKGWSDSYYSKRKALLRYNYSKKYVADVFLATNKIRTVTNTL
ncbi:MAG: lytic murein transglycosylase [Candidatus Marinimicrobia bacterium]|nr:lytic murein transglycosylase [Candidatus Neomarinimicrobiota bacterium]